MGVLVLVTYVAPGGAMAHGSPVETALATDPVAGAKATLAAEPVAEPDPGVEPNRAVEADAAVATVDWEACQDPPEGMVCIPGGPAVIGSDDGNEVEGPEHMVEVSTFYIDKQEVTNAEYRACERAGACKRRTGLPRSYRPFLAPNLPAIPIQWRMAYDYCLWAGKRLPTEAEWEKVARGGEEGRTYPWGEDPPTCNRAAFKGCMPERTHAVGSFAAGAYGVYDMAGNGYEWVQDWATDCYAGCSDACGEACLGRDPLGPCDGLLRCKGRRERVLKGGSWYWPSEQTRGSHRRAQRQVSGIHRLSFRCASSSPHLTTWPPAVLSHPRPDLAVPEPPTEEELALFGDVEEDDDVLKIKPCRREGTANLDCRDPMSYIKSNESLQWVWHPYIANLGGGYVGLGADQSYSFIASARSRWAWIFDYDPQVVRIHTLLAILIEQAESPAQLVDAFTARNAKQSRAWIDAALAEDKAERDAVEELYRTLRKRLYKHYRREMQARRNASGFGWLRYPENYAYVREMYAQGRVLVVKGNMLNDRVLPRIAAAARALGVPVRLFYPSNAAEQWELTPQYRANVAGLPFDEESLVLSTLISESYRRDDESPSYWHYLVHGGLDHQRKIQIESVRNVNQFTAEKIDTNHQMLSIIRIPVRADTQPATADARQPE